MKIRSHIVIFSPWDMGVVIGEAQSGSWDRLLVKLLVPSGTQARNHELSKSSCPGDRGRKIALGTGDTASDERLARTGLGMSGDFIAQPRDADPKDGRGQGEFIVDKEKR
jgi:hypothetical protein